MSKQPSEADLERAHLYNTGLFGRLLQTPLRFGEFTQRMNEGFFFIESEEGILRLRPIRREIIPIPQDGQPFHIPRSVRNDVIRDGGFTVSTDRAFEHVVDMCAAPRGENGEECRWIRECLTQLLGETHAKGYAHSIEIWKDGDLAGGVLGVTIGGIFTSLSVFSRTKGAGNAAYIELHQRLCNAGFGMHDAIVPSNISRFFGGYSIDFQKEFAMRREASCRNPAFPLDPVILPPETFPAPPKFASGIKSHAPVY